MNEIFETEQSLHDYAAFFQPNALEVVVFRQKFEQDGLDGLNQMLAGWYPTGVEDSEFVKFKRFVQATSAACQECRANGTDVRQIYGPMI